MNNFKLLTGIILSCMMVISFSFTAKANISQNWTEKNIISGREIAIDINADASAIVTRALLNRDLDIAVKLKELMSALGYSIQWNENQRFIQLENDENHIIVYMDFNYCEKNTKKINLNNSVFIKDDYSYCTQWFLENIIGVSITDIQIGDRRRIDGISLYAPNLAESARKPLPETKLMVNGKPLYINYAEFLEQGLPYNTVLSVVECINGNSEQVIIYSEEILKDFKIVSVKFNSTVTVFSVGEIIAEFSEIEPPMAVMLKTNIPEGIPVEAIIFTDSNGVTHSYMLSYNGKDGTVSANAVNFQ